MQITYKAFKLNSCMFKLNVIIFLMLALIKVRPQQSSDNTICFKISKYIFT